MRLMRRWKAVIRHGNDVSARANRNAVRKFSDIKQQNYLKRKKVKKWTTSLCELKK